MAHEIFKYDVYGVVLESEIKLSLPEVDRACAPTSCMTVRLVLGSASDFEDVSEDVASAEIDWCHHRVLANGALYLRWEDWFEFLVAADGSRIVCRNLSNRSLHSFEAYLVNFAVSAALMQQGEETIHSTALQIGGHGVALLGSSGAGKSSLVAFLTQSGANVITDDMLRITFSGREVLAHPGPHRLKLFPEAASRVLPSAAIHGRWSPLGAKLIYDLPDLEKTRETTQLRAFYHLNWMVEEQIEEIKLEKLYGIELFRTISASTMNYRLHTPARLERQFRFAERVAQLLPVYRLSYPRTFDVFPKVEAAILESTPKRGRRCGGRV